MTTPFRHLCAKGEAFRRRYERILPGGLYARAEAQHIARHKVDGHGWYGPARVRVSILLKVFANRLCGQDLWGLLRGQWVCSIRWDAGRAPSDREVLWAVREGLERCEREHRRWLRRRKRWAAMFNAAAAGEVSS